eukprot:gene7527-675_t
MISSKTSLTRSCGGRERLLHAKHTASSSTRIPVANEVSMLAAGNPDLLQDILVGGAVFGLVAGIAVLGLKKESVPCSLCNGNGGSKCFGCEGSGRMDDLIDRDTLVNGPQSKKRDPFGRAFNPRSCRICKGAGLTLCSQCKGSGYV